MRTYEDLNAWKKSHAVVLEIYALTESLPSEGRYGLQSQLRRAAVSVPSNIAEGAGRLSQKDYRRFVGHALGSASEVEYLLLLSEDLGLLTDTSELRERVREVKRLLRGLERHLAA